MIKMKYVFLLITVFSNAGLLAQDAVFLNGKVIGEDLMESSVHIVNLTQKTGTVNSEEGHFQIRVKEMDTLLFSSVQYELKKLPVTKEMIKSKYLEVNLISVQLEEVKISNINLSGNLERDLAGIETHYHDFGLPQRTGPKLTHSERMLYTAGSGGPIGVLIDVISGRMEMLQKHNDNMKRKALVYEALDNFDVDFFEKDLGLKGDEIINFLFYCSENDPDFESLIKKNDPFVLIEYYKKMLPDFLKERNAEKRAK